MKAMQKVATLVALMAASANGVEMPDRVFAGCEGFTNELARIDGGWVGHGVSVKVGADGEVSVSAPSDGLSWVLLVWRRDWPDGTLVLGDAWERSNGELEWRSVSDDEQISPWYFLASSGDATDGYGVAVQPNALASWRVRKGHMSLHLDVRSGSYPVRLGGRMLDAARIVVRKGNVGESAFQAGREFCRMMCPKPRLPRESVYGYNDWYCAYGANTATNFLLDAAYVCECAEGLTNRPYVVMDDGWQKNSPPQMRAMYGNAASGMGPWDASGAHFGMEMGAFCRRIAELGAKPGLWYRPLRAWPESPVEWRLLDNDRYFDPSVPEVRAQIMRDMTRFREWGVKLVKIDYLTFDVFRKWGRNPVSCGPTTWRNRSRTTCEVLKDLYGAMREAAGDEIVLIGCNALNHLAAGVFDVQRIGGDTSGKNWKQTKNNGVNTLGFRAVQDKAFFLADGDCVGLEQEGAVPWEKNRQWLELIARSGTPLFVSWKRSLADDDARTAFRKMFRIASEPRPTGEPLDWKSSRFPARWRFSDGEASFDW